MTRDHSIRGCALDRRQVGVKPQLAPGGGGVSSPEASIVSLWVPEVILVTSPSCPNDLTSLDTVTVSGRCRRYHSCWPETYQVMLVPKKKRAWAMPDMYC